MYVLFVPCIQELVSCCWNPFPLGHIERSFLSYHSQVMPLSALHSLAALAIQIVVSIHSQVQEHSFWTWILQHSAVALSLHGTTASTAMNPPLIKTIPWILLCIGEYEIICID